MTDPIIMGKKGGGGPKTYIRQQAFDRTGPFQAFRIAAPAGKNHVQQGALHRPEGALPGAEVFFVLQELVDEHFGSDMQHVGVILVEGVQGADGQDGQQEGR